MRSLYIFLSLLALVLFPFDSVFAQIRSTDISISANPASPAPNQQVTATVSSFATDLNKAYIIWLLEGDQIASGVGKRSVSFNSGKLGSTVTITASIELVNGDTITKSLILTPAEIDILWEAIDSYTPPFYKGKALATIEGPIKVVAIPSVQTNGTKISPNNLSYTWKRNGSGQPTSSGWGKSYFIFENSFLDKNNEIEVRITDILGKTVGQGILNTTVSEPKVVFYKKDTQIGVVFDESMKKEEFIDKSGASIVAMPYFFSRKAFNENSLDFKWFIGNQEVVNVNDSRNELNVKGEEGRSGQAKIQLVLKNPGTIFQEASRVLNVIF